MGFCRDPWSDDSNQLTVLRGSLSRKADKEGPLRACAALAWAQITHEVTGSGTLEVLEIQDEGWSLQGSIPSFLDLMSGELLSEISGSETPWTDSQVEGPPAPEAASGTRRKHEKLVTWVPGASGEKEISYCKPSGVFEFASVCLRELFKAELTLRHQVPWGSSCLKTHDAAPFSLPLRVRFLETPISVSAVPGYKVSTDPPGLKVSPDPEDAGHGAPNPLPAALGGLGPDTDLGG
ncbi:hypothetical protein HPG69_012700 [Diceros bicornis minor]|uniref:Uncharacterized protein n=1 Tax=Diceros bicornis minor TaxID=77932 RepID=A0A7J7EID6_DICBM|nr:hypothetical protein HPG69_012700 [Diceros bicornis minor]